MVVAEKGVRPAGRSAQPCIPPIDVDNGWDRGNCGGRPQTCASSKDALLTQHGRVIASLSLSASQGTPIYESRAPSTHHLDFELLPPTSNSPAALAQRS